eukprot:6166580-Pyramimonas_sp.AAC.1
MKAFEWEERRGASPREMARLRRPQGDCATGPLFPLSAVCGACCARKPPVGSVGGVVHFDPACSEFFLRRAPLSGADPGRAPRRRATPPVRFG